MKKLKPLHWILIAVLLVEIITCIWFFTRPTNNVLPNDTELTLQCEQADGVYTLHSIFDEAEVTTFKFVDNAQEYVFDSNVVDMIEFYRNQESFSRFYPTASDTAWAAYKEAVETYLDEQVNQQHAGLEYIKSVATEWYQVESNTTFNNNGFYTIQTTTTLNEWLPLFEQYQLSGYDGTLDEMALSAILRINDTQYPAMVYMRVMADSDTTNNDTAPEVTISVLFGDSFIQDFSNSEATLYFLKPDGSEYFAHSTLQIAFHANLTENHYRALHQMIGG